MTAYFNQFSVLLLSTIFISLVSGLLQIFLVDFFEVDITSNYIVNGLITQIFVFIGGGLLYLKLTAQSFYSVIQIKSINLKGLLTALGLFIVAIALSNILSVFNAWAVDFDYFKDALNRNEEIVALQTKLINSFEGVEIIYAVAFFGVLPAVAEEFLFRGLLQKIMVDWTKSVYIGITLTALCFAILHFQIQSVLPIFGVGLILGYTYDKLNNIWYPIIIHFLYNSLQVLMLNYG
ncbi:hypothetical protein DNU06_03655 [Putridiphycobacter roseus]|uniref:CAAX prenyl protease 2/Lysostaphin resistance protein A-like domain-containing protein n=1 Tax=Putridiphycobacter roseus TaxID=2219161 RepID=A0A2W1NM51_9FLAO|nr:type II CAAX endopeptidase family protein [Putridiphycobacter roseus]PZE18936.1 hypothetical protein DNU06_03655 [Putridiphycobacter roseus]